jgi:hypothetical protein
MIMSITIFNFTWWYFVAKKRHNRLGPYPFIATVATNWRAYMKTFISISLASITALYTLNAIAQEPEDTGSSSAQDTEMYIEEIRRTCEAEAAGLPDAEAYISECINNMKQSFTGQQD